MATDPREFSVRLLSFKEIHELPGSWPLQRLRRLLEILEIDEVSDAEAMDMALMALQDFDPEDAAGRVLEAVFGDAMRAGVRQNLAHDLSGARPWEEFADLGPQAGIFETCVLLQRAFPRDFEKPDAIAVSVAIETASRTGAGWVEALSPDPGLMLRLLAPGMGDRAVLRRLFGDALAGPSFPEAAGIVWHLAHTAPRELSVSSSVQFFGPLEDADAWTAKAWPDPPA
jgi:hypothetical protein